MAKHEFRTELWLPQDRNRVFEFFSDAHNLQRITPPWVHFKVLTEGPVHMEKGTLIDYTIGMRGLPLRWRTEIVEWNPPYSFADLQLKGPYKLWHHRHTFTDQDGGTLMTDHVEYELPLGPLGEIAHALFVKNDVQRIFAYRNQTIPTLIANESERLLERR